MEFCRDQFWDVDIFWNTTNPNLTDCCQNVLWLGVSSLYVAIFPLWLLSIFWGNQNHPNIRILPQATSSWGFWLIFTRCLMYFFVFLVSLIVPFLRREIFLSDILYSVFLSAAALISLATEIVMKQKLIHTSAYNTAFWSGLFLVSVPGLKISIEGLLSEESTHEENYHALVITRFALILVSWILQAFSNPSLLPPGTPPETQASVLSTLFFSWYTALVYQGWRSPLEMVNVPELPSKTSVTNNAEIFKEEEERVRKVGKPMNLWKSMFRCFSKDYFIGMTLFFIRLAFVFCAPFLVKVLIRYTENKDEPEWRGYLYAFTLFFTNTLATILDHNGLRHVCISANQCYGAIVTAVYRKSLRLSNGARKKFTTGEVTNHISVDARRVIDTVPFSYFMIVSPVELIVAFVLLFTQLGVSVFAAVGVMALMIPLNIWTSNQAESYTDIQLKAKDERIKLMNEIIAGIKVLKLYAWEMPFVKEVSDIRQREIDTMRFVAKLWSLVSFTFGSIPFLMTLAAFFTFIYSNHENVLTTDLIFVSLALFNSIRTPLTLLPLALISVIKLVVSVKRLEEFLNAEELDSNDFQFPTQAQNCIEIINGSFTWSQHKEEDGVGEENEGGEQDGRLESLTNINLKIEHGKLVAVVGVVGAGKSSLLSAILGEMAQTDGEVRRSGSVAYVAQQAWIQNLSVKDNILFGRTADEDLYQSTLSSCSLLSDLSQLPAGDQTEIGENGINLSGGQKQRVALARAVYQQADLYLLDDPLAALDAHVGADVFHNVISNKGMLCKKTRILVTHNLWALKHVDRIVVIRDGKIAEDGSYRQLLDNKGPFSEFLKENTNENDSGLEEDQDSSNNINLVRSASYDETYNQQQKTEDQQQKKRGKKRGTFQRLMSQCEDGSVRSRQLSITSTLSVESGDNDRRMLIEDDPTPGQTSDNQNSEAARLIEDEDALTGNVKWAIFLKYFKALGWLTWLTSLLLYFVCQALLLGTNVILAQWTDDPKKNDPYTRDVYMITYASVGVIESIFFLLKELVLYLACVKASRVIHYNLMQRIIHSPMEFFDTNPIGRVLNRFSTDIDCIDQAIPFTIDDLLNCLVEVLGVLCIISYSTPWFLAAVIPLSLAYLLLQRFYISTSRQLRRLEMISVSPIFAHFTETLTGAVSIRAFDAEARFILQSEKLMTTSNRCNWNSLNSNRWLGIRLETLGNIVIFLAAILAVIARETISGGIVGLSLSNSLMCVETLNWLVRMVCSLETNAISLERVFEYTDDISQEADWETQADKRLVHEWPQEGRIDFAGVTTSYREGLPPVIKDLDINIKAGEKIGVCGRTGAGKSSLSLTLFRIMENTAGCVLIDGIDIATLGLQKLRSRLTIIPQDPVLFSRSLRFNLDPSGQYSDLDITQSLEHAGLSKLTGQLDMEIEEKGGNLSVGQRQLVCLARAILRNTRILVLDEATAAVDVDTDSLVQQTIRSQFGGSTVLTIAHRLNTILDSDRVMVLDKGTLKEFDSPHNLLKDKKSIFYSLAKESGLA